jgi:hypothetical protein
VAGRVGRYDRRRTNVAREALAAVIGSVQVGLVPLHPPDQERKRQPFAAVAVSVVAV